MCISALATGQTHASSPHLTPCNPLIDQLSMKRPRQTSLFDPPAEVADSMALVGIQGARTQLSPGQRTFNRLTESIRRQRESLAEWQAYGQRFRQRLAAEYIPAIQDLRVVQRRMAGQLDFMLSQPGQLPRLGHKKKDLLRERLLELIDDLLVEGPDEELETLHDRHNPISRADRQRMEMEMTEDLLGGLFGEEMIQGHTARDMESLLQEAQERILKRMAEELQAQEARKSARAAKRGRGSRAEQAAERRAQAEKELKQSLREIYRKLASGLHPDRESDPVERERKTALMQRVNEAHGKGDLLTLLSLQMQAEQIDATHLANLSTERLGHYNQILRDQLKALEAELHTEIAAFSEVLEFDIHHRLSHPLEVDGLLDDQIAELRLLATHIEEDRIALADPARRRVVIDLLTQDLGDTQDALDSVFLDALLDMPVTLSPRSRHKKPRSRKN